MESYAHYSHQAAKCHLPEDHQLNTHSLSRTITLRGWTEPQAPRVKDNRHMKVVRLSAPRTGRLYRTGNIPVLISVRG